jgi:hypothetical protein
MAEGRSFYLASPMTYENLWDGPNDRPRVFQAERNEILGSGQYGFSSDGQYLVPSTP